MAIDTRKKRAASLRYGMTGGTTEPSVLSTFFTRGAALGLYALPLTVDITPDADGREPIWVDQPNNSGTNYPFVAPSDDIKYLLGDLFVSFDDISDTFVWPLKIAWLYGFGSNVVSAPPGYPTPVNAFDIIIQDANNVVVFNSTESTRFTNNLWDNRLRILEWTNVDRVLRCTHHIAWTQQDIDDGLTVTYDNYIEPVSGVLQTDTWYKLPKRVLSLQVGVETVEHSKLVTFSEGYNMQLEHLDESIAPVLTLPNFSSTKKLVLGEESLINFVSCSTGCRSRCVSRLFRHRTYH